MYQSHRNNFGSDIDQYDHQTFSTKDFSLMSAAMPQANKDSCYMLGDHEDYDNIPVTCFSKPWKTRFLNAVKEYNEYFK